MQYLNLPLATLDAEEFLGCDPVERATWLCLLRYCAGQENGGVIPDCLNWKDRKWQQLVRITLEEVMHTCRLWRFEGKNLLIWGYPGEWENIVKQRRNAGRRGGIQSGENRAGSKSAVLLEAKDSICLNQVSKEVSKKERKGTRRRMHAREAWQVEKDLKIIERELRETRDAWGSTAPDGTWTASDGVSAEVIAKLAVLKAKRKALKNELSEGTS